MNESVNQSINKSWSQQIFKVMNVHHSYIKEETGYENTKDKNSASLCWKLHDGAQSFVFSSVGKL